MAFKNPKAKKTAKVTVSNTSATHAESSENTTQSKAPTPEPSLNPVPRPKKGKSKVPASSDAPTAAPTRPSLKDITAAKREYLQDTHARIVYKAGSDLCASLPHMTAYLGLPDTKSLREYINEGPAADDIAAWVDFRNDESMHVGKRPVAMTKSSLFKYVASSANTGNIDNAAPDAANNKASAVKVYKETVKAITNIIDNGSLQMFTKTAAASRFTISSADWYGQYLGEDINRAYELLRCALRLAKVEAKAVRSKANPHNKPAETLYFLTDADLQGGSAEEHENLPADNFSYLDLKARQAVALQEDIASNVDLSMEQRDRLFDTLERNLAKATADFSRLTSYQDVDEARPTLTTNQRIDLFRRISSGVEVVWPRPHGPQIEIMTKEDTVTTTNLNHDAETLGAIHADLNPDAAFVEPSFKARSEMLEFQKLLVTAAVATPTFEEACAYLGLDLPPFPRASAGQSFHDRNDLVKFLEPYANPRLTKTLLLKPHQVTGIAAARMMEQSPLHGLVLADDMGLGKTVEVLSTILMGAREAERTGKSSVLGSGVFKPNLIIAPAGALMPWKFDSRSYFAGELTLRFFYQTPAHAPEEDRASTIGITAQDLIASVASLDSSDPKTERVIYITSISTWAHRTVGKEDETNANPSVKNYNEYNENEEDDVMQSDELQDYDKYFHKCPGLFGRIAIDEAHVIKGMQTKAHKAVADADANCYILISGTPLSNRLLDFAGLLRIFFRSHMEAKVANIPFTKPEIYGFALRDMENDFGAMTLQQKLSADTFIKHLWMLNPKRFLSIAYGRTGKTPIDALRGSRVLPALFSLAVIRRSKGSVTKIGEHDIRCAEIPPASISVVEIKPFYAQKVKYRRIHIEEQERLMTALRDESNGHAPSGFQNAGAMRRLVLASSNAALDAFFQKGQAAANVFSEVLGGQDREGSLHDRASEFYHRVTRPESWLPSYSRDRATDILYQCSLSAKKSYLLGKLATWVLEQDRKVVLFVNWPQNAFDIEVLLSTAGLPFVSVKALSAQTQQQREKSIKDFSDPHHPSRVLVTSLRVAAQSLNLQVASAMMILDFPTSTSSLLQAAARVCRIGQTTAPIIEIIMCHNTVDQMIAAKTEEKQLPILAGSCALTATTHEVESHMRDKNLDQRLWAELYEDCEKAIVEEKAKRIYRMVIGSRCSHVGWGAFNVDLIDFMPGGRFENKPAQREQCVQQWTKDLEVAREAKVVAMKQSMINVAEKHNLNQVDLRRLLQHSRDLLAALDAGKIEQAELIQSADNYEQGENSGSEEVGGLQLTDTYPGSDDDTSDLSKVNKELFAQLSDEVCSADMGKKRQNDDEDSDHPRKKSKRARG